jgi:hypothetical protein
MFIKNQPLLTVLGNIRTNSMIEHLSNLELKTYANCRGLIFEQKKSGKS